MDGKIDRQTDRQRQREKERQRHGERTFDQFQGTALRLPIVTLFIPSFHQACRVKWFVNTGLAFNASVYRSIKSSDFDQFRDGWDWSVYHLIQTVSMPSRPTP